ncbi:MAG: ATP-dependent DNA helicase RecG [Flavobacteriales bacterium]|nr:ATP-dependent DNA helicase RecG [Flavobacteriales bacterium]
MHTSLQYIKGIGKNRAKILSDEFGLKNCYDIINFYPFRYIDKRKFYKVRDLVESNSYIQIIGFFKSIKYIESNKKLRLEGLFFDGEKEIKVLWFKGLKWVEKSINNKQKVVLFGKVNWFKNTPSMIHPEIEQLNDFTRKKRLRIKPIYKSSEKTVNSGMSNNFFIKLIDRILKDLEQNIRESLNIDINRRNDLISKYSTYLNVHFPLDFNLQKKAIFRLKFEEIFFNQLIFHLKKNKIKSKKSFYFPKIDLKFNSFYENNLNFELTSSQKNVLKEIRNDFRSGNQMTRLLQGDVGSGKTIVSLMAMLIAIDNGYQCCLVAPTEILANQHFENFNKYLNNLNLNIEILTGSVKKSKRVTLFDDLKKGVLDILIGTHAIFEENVLFKNLGFAVIDEQHRFGVKQRAEIWKKNNPSPHILIMTATPIPRTLTMSIYGDLDVSIINELPPGRKKINTLTLKDSKRLKVFKFMKDQIKTGRQVYIVYPLIEESKKMDLKNLEDGFESVCRYFDNENYAIGVLHGKMKSENKDFEMNRFVNGETNILVSTTVIEVGVNVPNASVMVIENAERFGLSQLHQLRGRVGRGEYNSYCILMTKDKMSPDAETRINAMVSTNDGFKISEIDLKLRGPGDILGTQQSGVVDFKIADLTNDLKIFDLAKKEVKKLISNDPKLKHPNNITIRQELLEFYNNKSWSSIG